MICDFVIDTFAWVEYFKGSAKGKIVDEYLNKYSVATPTIVLAELSAFYEKQEIEHSERDLLFITSKTVVVALNEEIAVNAGKIKGIVRKKCSDKKHFGLSDAIILATARKLNAKVLTGDKHFEGLTDAFLLK